MNSSRFIRVNPNALIKYNYFDNNLINQNYSVITDSVNKLTYFTFSTGTTDNNRLPNQLYLSDASINKYAVIDPINKPFLQKRDYTNVTAKVFDTVRIYFPINFNFEGTAGFYIGIYALSTNNNDKFLLTNFFIDITNSLDIAKVQLDPNPFRLNDVLWGKYVEINVPSVFYNSRDRLINNTQNIPYPNSINSNLTSQDGLADGLSQNSPISIDFRFITQKVTFLGQVSYLLTNPLIATLPQAPDNSSLGVTIRPPLAGGDYFEIVGTYNTDQNQFNNYMSTLEANGMKSYIIYSVTTYEENLPQTTVDYYVYQNFNTPIDFRPILKFTNTTATINVEMRIINSVSGEFNSKFAEIALMSSDVNKYGKFVTPINISGAIKPKIFKSTPDKNVLPERELIQNQLTKLAIDKITITKPILYPVLTNTFDVVSQDVSNSTVDNAKFSSLGQLNLFLTPFDNVIKIRISQSTNNVITPFNFNIPNSDVNLLFKSSTTTVRIPLYLESNDVDLKNGVLVFKIPQSQIDTIKKIGVISKIFYITLLVNGGENSIYDGTFTILSDGNNRPILTNTNTNATLSSNLNNFNNVTAISNIKANI